MGPIWELAILKSHSAYREIYLKKKNKPGYSDFLQNTLETEGFYPVVGLVCLFVFTITLIGRA